MFDTKTSSVGKDVFITCMVLKASLSVGVFKNKRRKGFLETEVSLWTYLRTKDEKRSWRLMSLYGPHEFLLAVNKVECCYTVQILS